MKSRTVLAASFLALAVAVAPPAVAGGRHGGHFGGGPIWGFAGAVVATAAAVITAPFAIAAAVAQSPVYYPQPAYANTPPYYPQGPAYSNSAPAYYYAPPAGPGYSAAPAYYNTPPAGPAYAAAPAYYNTPPAASSYYAPAPTRPQGEWYYCANAGSYYPYVRDCPGGWQRVPAQPPDANYNPR
jgi:hypothetical protein